MARRTEAGGQSSERSQNRRNWYLQISDLFFSDSEYERMRDKLQGVENVTSIYQKIILLAVKDNPDKAAAEEITLVYLHDEDNFPEEIARLIHEKTQEVTAVMDYMKDRGLLQEIEPDLYRLYFPEGTIGSITDSSLRSRRSRAKKSRMLQSNATATEEQQQSNIYNNNNKSYSYSDSNKKSYSYSDSNNKRPPEADGQNRAPQEGGRVCPPPGRLEELNFFTMRELEKMFPAAKYVGNRAPELIQDAFNAWDCHNAAELGETGLHCQIWLFTDKVLEVVEKYISYEFREATTGNIYEAENIDNWEEAIPLYCPRDALTTEQRRFLLTAFNVRFPAVPVDLKKDPYLLDK